MDPINNAALFSLLVAPEAIKRGAFLLGRYNAETKALTDIKVVNSRGHVPPNTELTEYKLIGIGDDVPGQPLDEFVTDNCVGWDGVTPLTLYFNRDDGEFVKWAHTPAGAAASP
jgi:hypothetical protein